MPPKPAFVALTAALRGPRRRAAGLCPFSLVAVGATQPPKQGKSATTSSTLAGSWSTGTRSGLVPHFPMLACMKANLHVASNPDHLALFVHACSRPTYSLVYPPSKRVQWDPITMQRTSILCFGRFVAAAVTRAAAHPCTCAPATRPACMPPLCRQIDAQ